MSFTFKAFFKNQAGTSAVLFALSLPAAALAVGGGIDMNRAITMRQSMASATEIACKQAAIEINFKASQTGADPKAKYEPDVEKTAKAKLADAGLTGVTPVATMTTTVITIKTAGTSANVFSGVLGYEAVPVSVTRDCARLIPPPPTNVGQVLFSESFEINHNVAPNDWSVLKNWNGWTTKDAGIEINGMPQLSGNVIRFGNFFAELDSHCYVSNCNSNSTMSREMTNLAAGEYELRYWYISRVTTTTAGYAGKVFCGTDAEASKASWNGQTNRIEVFVERQGNYNFLATSMVDVCVYSDTWTERKIKIVVPTAGTYRISWRAAGLQDTVGGLIDYLRFCTKTCP